MVKWSLRIFIILFLSLVISYFSIDISTQMFSELYMVIGIMFPIALNQIMAFSFNEIENDNFVRRYREQLKKIRTVFIILFVMATIIFLIKSEKYLLKIGVLQLDNHCLYIVFYILCLYYYIRNFISLGKLKDEIDDELRKYHKNLTDRNNNIC